MKTREGESYNVGLLGFMFFARYIAKSSGRDFSRPVTEGSDVVALAAKAFVDGIFDQERESKNKISSKSDNSNKEDPFAFVDEIDHYEKKSKKPVLSSQVDAEKENADTEDPLAFLDDWDEEKERPEGFESRWKAREAFST